MNKKKCVIFTLLVLVVQTLNAQSGLKPKWLTAHSVQSNHIAYDFILTEGLGETLANAKQACFANLTTKIESERGIAITSKIDATSTMSRRGDVETYNAERTFNIQYKESEKVIKVQGKVVDEYWGQLNGMYFCNSLYAVANGPYGTTLVDNIQVTTSYGIHGLWRSMIIPGWGQFYKGSKAKGGLMLGGCAAAAVAALFADNMVSDYQNKITQTHDVSHIRTYQSKIDNFAATRNICIGAAAAIYIYNLVDAIAAPGARRVKVSKSRNKYALSPMVSTDGSIMANANLQF